MITLRPIHNLQFMDIANYVFFICLLVADVNDKDSECKKYSFLIHVSGLKLLDQRGMYLNYRKKRKKAAV